jgi:triosephosphate isomerase (TIM)
MSKQPLIIGNWKMELSHKAATEVVQSIKKLLKGVVVFSEIVVCPSYPSLKAIAEIVKQGKNISVGAQNIHHEEKGAYTGMVSVVQIKPLVNWCIVGHSEQRAATGESEEHIVHKANLLLKHGIAPILCLGESEQERQNDQTVAKVTKQMQELMSNIERTSLAKLVIAYEPIWAVGTGVTPESDQVAEVILLIRKLVANRYDQDVADRLRILYGGSVTADNVGDYVGGPSADGVLVGGASVHPREFVEIIKNVQAALG